MLTAASLVRRCGANWTTLKCVVGSCFDVDGSCSATIDRDLEVILPVALLHEPLLRQRHLVIVKKLYRSATLGQKGFLRL